MSSKILINISQLLVIEEDININFLKGLSMKSPFLIENAWIKIENDLIHSYGKMSELDLPAGGYEVTDCTDCVVLPGFCDSHTHLVFAATREEEFVMKLKGETYESIAQKGGGILNSALKLRKMSENELAEQALFRLQEIQSTGTTSVEIKSGYGLDFNSEIKMLKVIQKLKTLTTQRIKATFLGAHAIPPEFKSNRKGYIDLITQKMIPYIAENQLADYVDVFCETNFFTENETDLILTYANEYGFAKKVHANELDFSGGVQVGVKHNAVSVDHLECIGNEELESLKLGNTVATLLPTTAFYLGIPYAPARKLIQEDICVALASDYNPGTSPSGNIPLVIALACTQMKMLPEEAIVAVTLNGAKAMDLSSKVGSLAAGKKADLLVTKNIKNFYRIPYSFGSQLIQKVMINGKWV